MKKWKAKLKNNVIVEENIENPNWMEVKDNINSLEMNNNGQIIKLPSNMDGYVQGKSASGDLISGECVVLSRYIGFTLGNNMVKIRVDEKTNNILVEVN